MKYFLSTLHIIILAGFTGVTHAQGPQADLDRNRALWESHNFSYYSFVVSKSCFCFLPPDARVIVADNMIYDVVDPLSGEAATMQNGEAVLPRFIEEFETIDELFDLIASEIESKGDALTGAPGWIPGISAVLYDERYGFPTAFSIDHSVHLDADGLRTTITDSGISYRLRGFVAVPSGD